MLREPSVKYISCFSGIGGLEASTPPMLLCESDPDAIHVLNALYPNVEVWPDVRTLEPPHADVVAGGWPCQDISVAGQQAGLSGLRSRLLLDMLRVAKQAGAHTIVAENVTNLLRMRRGHEFGASLSAFHSHGYPLVAWRVLNAREFGLPQNRSRLLIVASKEQDAAYSLFRPPPPLPRSATSQDMRSRAAGFYWTAGTHSINYSRGYVPTIKVGSALGIASPPAVHYENVVRTVTAREALALQGFDIDVSLFRSTASAYKAAGNAVARPIGRWLLEGLRGGESSAPRWLPTQQALWADRDEGYAYSPAGISVRGEVTGVDLKLYPRATNLLSFLDREAPERLSPRACRGLLERLTRSGQACPASLRELLIAQAA